MTDYYKKALILILAVIFLSGCAGMKHKPIESDQIQDKQPDKQPGKTMTESLSRLLSE